MPSLRGLSNPGIEPRSPTLLVDSLPSESSGKSKNTGMGSLSFLQWIFPTQESNQGLLHCRWILYQLSYQGNDVQIQSLETQCQPCKAQPKTPEFDLCVTTFLSVIGRIDYNIQKVKEQISELKLYLWLHGLTKISFKNVTLFHLNSYFMPIISWTVFRAWDTFVASQMKIPVFAGFAFQQGIEVNSK